MQGTGRDSERKEEVVAMSFGGGVARKSGVWAEPRHVSVNVLGLSRQVLKGSLPGGCI